MTAPRSTTSSDHTTRKIDLSLTQVVAAALAAVTSAVLGSRLGAAGTLIGAAGASAIVTVGTAVYRASLEHSREKIRSLARHTRRLPPPREGSGTGRFDPAPLGRERVIGPAPSPPDHFRRFARLRWGAMAVAALGGFALAMMVITGVEWARGETLGGNGDGTTIGRVVDAPSTPRHPRVPRAPQSSETSEAPSETSAPNSSTPNSSSPETTAPDGSSSAEPNPSTTPDPPAPSEVRPTPPVVPTRLPSAGSF